MFARKSNIRLRKYIRRIANYKARNEDVVKIFKLFPSHPSRINFSQTDSTRMYSCTLLRWNMAEAIFVVVLFALYIRCVMVYTYIRYSVHCTMYTRWFHFLVLRSAPSSAITSLINSCLEKSRVFCAKFPHRIVCRQVAPSMLYLARQRRNNRQMEGHRTREYGLPCRCFC